MFWKRAVKAIAFILIFLVVFGFFSGIVTNPADYRNYQWIRGFYEEPRNSLDAVYIGSSAVYAFWNPLVAWEKYGIAVYPYTCNAQHLITADYMLKEVRKTQPDCLYIVNLNTIYDQRITLAEFHYLLDYMPFSLNKLQLTAYLAKTANLTFDETLELFVPMFRYHSRWNELVWEDFNYQLDGLKGASDYSAYYRTIKDISQKFITTEECSTAAPHVVEAVNRLLDYCDKEGLNMLFVTSPRVEKKLIYSQQINYIEELIRSRGYEVLDLVGAVDEIGLTPKKDYYNITHVNIHGSVKCTQYLSEYLIENYGFTDKRDDPAYESWDAGLEAYRPALDAYILDFEKETRFRDNALKAPSGLTVTATDAGIEISWKAVKGAEGYVVYQKLAGNVWQPLATITQTSFTDDSVTPKESYYYTVVPYRDVDGVRQYGDFSYNGKNATAL